jgi:hypothetical protein
LSINTATLAHYLFATERLGILGEAVIDLSGLDVKDPPAAAQFHEALCADAHIAGRGRTLRDGLRTGPFAILPTSIGARLASALRRYAVHARRSWLMYSASLLPNCAWRSNRRHGRRKSHWMSSPAEPTVSTANTGTAAPRRHTQAEGAIPAKTEGAAVHSRVIEQVRLCAGFVGISDCLRSDEAAPLGYCMDAFADSASWRFAASKPAMGLATLDAGVRNGGPAGKFCNRRSYAPLIARPRVPDLPVDAFQFDAAFFGWLVDANDQNGQRLLGSPRSGQGISLIRFHARPAGQ